MEKTTQQSNVRGRSADIQVNEPEKKKKKKSKKTGAKKIGKFVAIGGAIGVIALCGHIAAKGGIDLSKFLGTKESKLANSLVEEYTVDGVFNAPESVIIDRAYDCKYCDGEVLAEAMVSSNVKYCEIFDEYYTADGRDIAIVTLQGERVEAVEAEKIVINGATIYMPPAGYELEGDTAIRTVTETIVKIVPKSETGDYSNIILDGVRNYEIINVEERQTNLFSSMTDMVLIVDVPDNAVLENNQCAGALNLVPKNR
ncbi:MAG: hypothetical protein K2H20_00985 [Bacilli bacterium]|nr:hypothetical protein [Bacilli bacterium]